MEEELKALLYIVFSLARTFQAERMIARISASQVRRAIEFAFSEGTLSEKLWTYWILSAAKISGSFHSVQGQVQD